MKCNACGAPVENGKCTYCGKMFTNEEIAMITLEERKNLNRSSGNQGWNDSTSSTTTSKRIDKSVALLLCIFLGYLGMHKFYEGKVGMGILYIFTMGLFGVGWILDIIIIAGKPNPYYV